MKYVLLLGFCAVIFLICFLIDKLIQKLFPKHELEKSKTVVRPPRKSAVFGVLLLVFPLMALLFLLHTSPFPSTTGKTAFCIKPFAAAKRNTATRTFAGSAAS